MALDDRRINAGKKWNATKEVGCFFGAEATSILVSIGVFTFLDEIAPDTMKTVSKVIGKTCVEPYLDTIEKGMKTFCRSKDCQVDPNKPRAERAEAYANYLTRFTLSFATGIGIEFFARNKFNKWAGVKEPMPNTHAFGIDKFVHLGALGVVNTIGAKQTDEAIDTTSNIFQKTLGWSKERSHKAADSVVRWEASNLFSSLVTAFCIVKRQLGGGTHR